MDSYVYYGPSGRPGPLDHVNLYLIDKFNNKVDDFKNIYNIYNESDNGDDMTVSHSKCNRWYLSCLSVRC
jgi:hypothetical protein